MDISNASDLGALVRKARKRAGLSQTELAQLVGTTRQWLSRFEQGSNDVSLGSAFSVLEALGIKLFSSSQAPSVDDQHTDASNERHYSEGSGEPLRNLSATRLQEGSANNDAADEGSDLVTIKSDPGSFASQLRQRDALGTMGDRFRTRPGAGHSQRRGVPPVTAPGTSRSSGIEDRGLGSKRSTTIDDALQPSAEGASTSPSSASLKYSIDADIARIAKSTLFKR